ncbi:GyrI-like domain-containing protein [Labilibacter sediminis]|nr:GyrI-like domain-containing protein [Labilibacter sediminis]
METKKIEKTLVAVHSFKTTLAKINDAVGIKPNLIAQELAKQAIEPTASQIWNYIDCDGKPDTEFTLEICFPVKQRGEDTNDVSFKTLNNFSCISHVHEGPWNEFSDVYEKLFAGICKDGYTPTGQCREVYHHCDFEDQSKCVTEIQVEVK